MGNSTRRDKVRELKASGMTYAEIGATMGISRQRVQQILAPAKRERERLIEQFSGKCAECGHESDRLCAHHDDYEKDPERMLCPSCHKKADVIWLAENRESSESSRLHEPSRPIGKAIITTVDAAAISQCTVKAIQAAIHRGKLPARKIGRDWQIDPQDFDAWLASPRQVGYPAGRPRTKKQSPSGAPTRTTGEG